MAASIPFPSIDDVILALAKIDVLHKHIAHAEGDASTIGPGDDFLLIPYCIHDVARGDHLLFDGASFFGESADLRFRVEYIRTPVELRAFSTHKLRICV